MSKDFDESLETDFYNILGDFFKPITDLINEKLVTYYNELNTNEISKDEIFLKIIQKSNTLVLKEAVNFSALFSNINPENKKILIQRFKEIMDSKG